VKCDETKPSCKACDKFMVHCNYDGKQQDLEVSHSRTSNSLSPTLILNPLSVNDALLGMINTTLRTNYPSSYEPLQLGLPDLDKLRRWQTRTVLTIGSPATAAVYQRAVIKLVAKVTPPPSFEVFSANCTSFHISCMRSWL